MSMKSTLLLVLFAMVLSFVAGCKAPDEATSDAGKKDSTSKAAKAAGADE